MAVKASASITLSSVIDVKAAYRFYLLQSSTLSAPSKPTVYPPPSTWDDVEPTYTDGSTNSLYTVDCTVFCDDTFAYSAVSLSSSYEAAKVAYNKAVNAAKTATNFLSHDETNGLEVGDKTNGEWSSYRARIKAGAVEILDKDGNVLATFGANEIMLGNNRKDTVIKLCGDLGSIEYDADSDGMKMKTDGYLRLDGMYILTHAEEEMVQGDGSVVKGESVIAADAHMSKHLNPSVRITSRYFLTYNDNGTAAEYDPTDSSVIVSPDGVVVDSSYSIRLIAPTGVAVEGGLGVEGELYIGGTAWLDKVYPVNSIYLSYSHTSPASLFGGTWTRISPYFLYATGATGTIGETGGANSVTLSVANLPSHNHTGLYYYTNPSVSAYGISLNNGSTGYKMSWTARGTGSGTAEIVTGKTGSGTAVSINPPFIKISAWRRTA